jgi:hypothetical protein
MTQIKSPSEIGQFNVMGQVGATGTPGSYLYGKPKITGDNLQKQDKIDLSGTIPQGGGGNADAVVSGANANIDETMKNITPAETPEEKTTQQWLNDVAGLTKQLGDVSAEQATAEDAAGLGVMRQNLAGINTKIKTATAEYNALKSQYDQTSIENRGKSISMSSIIGNEAQINFARQQALNNKAADIDLLIASSQGLQGEITAAQDTVNRAIDLRYKALENQIAAKQAQLDALAPTLKKQDQTRLLAQQTLLDREKQALQDKKDKEKQIQSVMLEAAKNGADKNTLDKISKASSIIDAITYASSSLSTTGTTGNWSMFENSSGEQMMFDKDTGAIKPISSSSVGTDYFTDANGVSWNIGGWATDTTKAQQMQSISQQIGKVNDSNIDAKVKQFTPGLTADMIRKASAESGVSWEAIMTMVNQESTGGTSNVAKNNNNFGGLTWSDGTQWASPQFGGTKGTARPTAEGGNYIKFPTKQAGLNAMATLMKQYGTAMPKEAQVSDEVKGYVSQINSGAITIPNVPEKLRGAVVTELAKNPSPKDNTAQLAAKDKINLIAKIENHPGLDTAVGPNALARKLGFGWGVPGALYDSLSGNVQDFVGSVENLIQTETLSALLNLKKAGGTLGALSEGERQMLQESASKIGNWAIKDKTGKVTGYNISEKAFKEELARLKELANRAVVNSLTPEVMEVSDGSRWQINPDGTFTKI